MSAGSFWRSPSRVTTTSPAAASNPAWVAADLEGYDPINGSAQLLISGNSSRGLPRWAAP